MPQNIYHGYNNTAKKDYEFLFLDELSCDIICIWKISIYHMSKMIKRDVRSILNPNNMLCCDMLCYAMIWYDIIWYDVK